MAGLCGSSAEPGREGGPPQPPALLYTLTSRGLLANHGSGRSQPITACLPLQVITAVNSEDRSAVSVRPSWYAGLPAGRWLAEQLWHLAWGHEQNRPPLSKLFNPFRFWGSFCRNTRAWKHLKNINFPLHFNKMAPKTRIEIHQKMCPWSLLQDPAPAELGRTSPTKLCVIYTRFKGNHRTCLIQWVKTADLCGPKKTTWCPRWEDLSLLKGFSN